MMDSFYRLYLPSLEDPFGRGRLEFHGVFMEKLPIKESDAAKSQ